MDVGNGKLIDVLIEENEYPDRFGISKFACLTVWADPNMKNNIESVEGVTVVYDDISIETKYTVYLDPRYDRQWVINEIEAAIKCSGE